MVIGNINGDLQNNQLCQSIKKCLAFAKKNKMNTWKAGSYCLDEKGIRLNINEYTTSPRTSLQTKFEAHKKYMDLQLILVGRECADFGKVSEMERGEYEESRDFMEVYGHRIGTVVLSEGDFIICYPEDAHCTAITDEEDLKVKKAVFKIPVL